MYFPRVRGHERAKKVLARALERDRVPPALILTGRKGVGRALLARELAKALNCKGSEREIPCGVCNPCRRIEEGIHPDVIRVSPEERVSITIDQVRALTEEMALAPVEGRKRVFIIDPADLLTEDAMNALLKALEEPPARAHVILVAPHEDALLRTIGSRCFSLALGELSFEEVKAVLVGQGLSPEDAANRAAWAGGSPGIALADTHLDRAREAAELLEALASGAASRDPLGYATDVIARVCPRGTEAAERRAAVLEVTDLVARGLRDALDTATRGGEAARISGADPSVLARLATSGPIACARAIEAVTNADEKIAANHNVNLAVEGLVLDVTAALRR